LGDVSNTDTYYDSPSFELTTNELWLRERNGRFELKVPKHELGGKGTKVEHFLELENVDEIRDELGLDQSMPFATALKLASLEPFATIVTTRRKYEKNGFHIDLDEADFGYRIAEIELMVENGANLIEAEKRLLTFAEQNGMKIEPIMGKVLMFIKKNRPEHFKALQVAGVI